MKRKAGGLVLAASLLALAPSALAGEAEAADARTEQERKLDAALAELDAQRLEIAGLKAKIAPTAAAPQDNVGDAVKKYLESDEGKKALGKGATDFKVSWKEGLSFESADKAFTLKVNGRIMFDTVMPDADDDVEVAVGDFDTQVGFRRLRIEMTGTIYENVYYANVVDFSATPHQLKDNYIGIKGLPAGIHFQAGYFKEPVGLEELTSSKYITFTERSIATNAFAPAHNMGFMAFASHMEDRLNWAFGTFTDHAVAGVGNVNWKHSLTGRICFAPIVDKEAKRVLHLGLSYQDRSPDSENDRVRVRPEVPFLPRTQDTGTFSVESESILGLEAAFVQGPFSVQGEYYKASYTDHPDAPGPSPGYSGYYLMASYFITGETRPYKGGTFGRVKPNTNFDGKKGCGALEVAARYSACDLDDDGLDGGVGHDLTLGVNWHLNPNTRVMLDYVMYTLHHVGDVNSLVLRFQVDF